MGFSSLSIFFVFFFLFFLKVLLNLAIHFSPIMHDEEKKSVKEKWFEDKYALERKKGNQKCENRPRRFPYINEKMKWTYNDLVM